MCSSDLKFRAALAHQNAAGGNQFAAKAFYSQPFANAVAPIADAALTFFVCHKLLVIRDPSSSDFDATNA